MSAGMPGGVTAGLPVDKVSVAGVEHAAVIRPDRGIRHTASYAHPAQQPTVTINGQNNAARSSSAGGQTTAQPPTTAAQSQTQRAASMRPASSPLCSVGLERMCSREWDNPAAADQRRRLTVAWTADL